ncbi:MULTISPECIES: AI-2E family transporter [Chelativorans]|uniref:AI-2E family transporter n=1 Tax=Chelativorans sp. (strain BNC1) TaxID=266779 RepID=Q11GK7_CHESB
MAAHSGGKATEGQDHDGDSSYETRAIRYLLVGVFLILFVAGLYFARDFFMPVVIAFLMAMTLTPIVRFLGKRGIPAALSATLLVFASWSAIGMLGYAMSGPVIELVDDAPRIGSELRQRVAELRRPLEDVMEASEQIKEATEAADEPGVQRVVIAQPGIISRAAGNLLSVATTVGITLVLTLFLLASGTLFYEKIVQSFGALSDKKRALRIVFDVEREVSRYLLTIALINSALGVTVGIGLWGLGVPNALVWGVAAAVLNFLPYVGAIVTFGLVAIISLVTFESLYFAMLPPLYVALCNTLEGQFVTPLVLGRRLELNAVAIFIAVAFWSWLWGIVGALIAVPLLVVVKVFCDHFDGLRHVGNFLAAQGQVVVEEDVAETAKIRR